MLLGLCVLYIHLVSLYHVHILTYTIKFQMEDSECKLEIHCNTIYLSQVGTPPSTVH